MSASCKPRVQLFADAGNGWPHSALRYHQLMPISCHFRDCKALLIASLTHVRSATASTASTRPLPLPFTVVEVYIADFGAKTCLDVYSLKTDLLEQ